MGANLITVPEANKTVSLLQYHHKEPINSPITKWGNNILKNPSQGEKNSAFSNLKPWNWVSKFQAEKRYPLHSPVYLTYVK